MLSEQQRSMNVDFDTKRNPRIGVSCLFGFSIWVKRQYSVLGAGVSSVRWAVGHGQRSG